MTYKYLEKNHNSWISIHGTSGDCRLKAFKFDCTKYHTRATAIHTKFKRDDTNTIQT